MTINPSEKQKQNPILFFGSQGQEVEPITGAKNSSTDSLFKKDQSQMPPSRGKPWNKEQEK